MDDQTLKQLALQKEKEWLGVMQERLVALEATVEHKDQQIGELNQKYTRLSEDFKYNLKLIDDRDKELATFDNRFKELKKVLNEKNSEISELKIVNDQLYQLKKQIEAQIDEEKKHFLHRLSIKEKDLGSYKQQCDQILQTEREQLEQERRAINRRLTELENELERQRRELTNEFETQTKKFEFDWKRKYDDVNNLQLASELKSKLLLEEIEQHLQTIRQLELNKTESMERIKTLEKLVKEQEWQLHEQEAVKNARIKELESKCNNVDGRLQEREDDYSRKYSELDRLLREKEVKLEQFKESYQELEGKWESLNEQCFQLRQQLNEKQREHEHLIRDKDTELSNLQDEINRIKKQWNHQLTQISKEHANENIEHRALQEECDTLKGELKIKDNHINRYKKELEDALDRERALEEAKVQLDFDWQKKFEQNQRQEYHKSEDLIEKISSAHEQSIAQVKKLENDLKFKDDLLKAYSNQYKSNGGDGDALVVLQRENENLRSVITQMRQQMEALMNDLPGQTTSGQPSLVTELQTENQTLRQQNRDLITRLDSRHSNVDVDHTVVNNELKKNPQLNSYVQSLNNTVAALRTEKMQLVSQVRKLEGRLIQIEKNHDNFQRELRSRQSRIDQLTYQLNTDERRHQTELTSIKQKMSDLEVHLLETRREADEYQKSIIERNADVAELERKLSEAKLELAGRTPLFNYGGQEILIQQLQDEIERLTKKYADVRPKLTNDDNGIDVSQVLLQQENDQLKRRLEQSNIRIQTLIRDKERLLEISNHLRSQLNHREDEPVLIKRPQIVDTIPTNQRSNVSNSPKRDVVNLENKLQRLEQLQYALTKQELENRKRAHLLANELQQQRPISAPEKSENPLMESDNTVTTIASENIRDLWKVLDNTPGKGPSIAKSSTININAQRKALTARTTRTSNPTRGGARGGVTTRTKVRNWNSRDD
ncbi:unnamed protein product [Adineta ricciae]|uniref:Uncharacterized protein n=1 Tax=Adineta ricciae TaxID=249248 RepID=A0A815D6Y4_ADIRI|nr:unnamed protein product [Adineta ricciae]CAF1334987.1 unnamed protein product [Adineta ricciae]